MYYVIYIKYIYIRIYLTVSFVDEEEITVVGLDVVEIIGEVMVTVMDGVTDAFCVTRTKLLGGISAFSYSKSLLFFLLGNIIVRKARTVYAN